MTDLIEHLADAWRWWASLGAFLAFFPTWARFRAMTKRGVEPADLPALSRALLNIATLLLLAATFIMGAVIPWANDGRLEDFTRESIIYKHSIALGWLLWGSGCWAAATAFAHHRWKMVGASVLFWFAMFVAVDKTAGAML